MTSTCRRHAGLFPWLLNGTLPPEEEREVREHLAGCAPCRDELEETRLAGGLLGGHPPPEAIVTHLFGGAGAVESELVARHLAACERCAAEAELVRRSRELEGADVAPPAAKIAGFPGGPAAGSLRRWRALAAAAGLFGLAAGAGWLYTGSRLLRAARPGGASGSPIVNLPVLELHPVGSGIRGEGEEPVLLTLPAATGAVALILSAPPDAPDGDFELVRIGTSGATAPLARGLRLQRPGGFGAEFTLTLPAGLLPDGEVVLELRPAPASTGTEPLRYALKVSRDP